MDLSIIIVNWNSVDYIRKCLRSIFSETRDLDFEVIVVDNASYDGSKELIEREFNSVIYVQSEKNIGFARANNLGFKFSSGNVLLFLNPDTEIIDHAINRMYSQLARLPDAGAIGGKLLNPDLSVQTSTIQTFPTLLNQAVNVECLKRISPWLDFWGIKPLFYESHAPAVVEVITGACVMIRREVFEKIGLFSTDYFMYAEDLDLCYKVKAGGWKVYYTGDAKVIHHGGGSTKSTRQNSYSVVLTRESVQKFLQKTRGKTYGLLFKVTTALIAVLRLVLITMALLFDRIFFDKSRLYFVFNKWKNILRWAVGLEKWAKEVSMT